MGDLRRWAVGLMTLLIASAACWVAVPAQASQIVVPPVGPLPVGGVELFPGVTQAGFLGGVLPPTSGYWVAQVQHSPDLLAMNQNMEITGGSLRLAATLGTSPILMTATGMSGQVISTGMLATCPGATMQNPMTVGYPIHISLTGVTVNGSATPLAMLDGTLTHYFFDISGVCVPFAATIEGVITVIPPP